MIFGMTADESSLHFHFEVDDGSAGMRLDVFLSSHIQALSRSQLRKVISSGLATTDGQPLKPSSRLRSGQSVDFTLPPPPPAGPQGEDIPLDILFEDDHLVVVNKPPEMVVHPSTGHWSGTLASGLVYHFEQLSDTGGVHRPGIIHRLDRDTSGCIVVAKTNQAHANVSEQFAQRTVEKTYLAVVDGVPGRDRDIIDKPIGIHPRRREKMAIRPDHSTSRNAKTFYEVQERFSRHALLKVKPRTGRTHQIRVHLEHIGHPVACDAMYGRGAPLVASDIAGQDIEEPDAILLKRQALHAQSISFRHPTTGATVSFDAPLPDDIEALLAALRHK